MSKSCYAPNVLLRIPASNRNYYNDKKVSLTWFVRPAAAASGYRNTRFDLLRHRSRDSGRIFAELRPFRVGLLGRDKFSTIINAKYCHSSHYKEPMRCSSYTIPELLM